MSRWATGLPDALNPRSNRRAGLRWLLLISTSALIYVIAFVLPYPLSPFWIIPFLDLGKMADHTPERAAFYAGAMLVSLILYAYGYWLLRGRQGRAWLLTVFTGVSFLAFALTFAYPIGAADIFEYIFFGRMIAAYRANPLVDLPAGFSHDPLYPYIVWAYVPAPYGPIWLIASALANAPLGVNLPANLLAFKGLAILTFLTDAAIIYAIVAQDDPGQALSRTFLFLGSPLLLFEIAVNGHNDAAMMLFSLLSLWLCRRGRYGLAMVAAAAAPLVKVSMLVLVPLVAVNAWQAWRRDPGRQRRALIALSAAAVMVVLTYLPFWAGPATLNHLGYRGELFTSSPATIIALGLALFMEPGLSRTIARILALGLFGLWYLGQWSRLDGTYSALAVTSFRTTFVFLAVATLWFQPWYVLWLLALAPLQTEAASRRLAVLFSCTASWSYVVYHFLWFWNPPLFNWGETLGIHLVSVAVIFVPVLAYVGLGRLWRRTMRKRLAPATAGQS